MADYELQTLDECPECGSDRPHLHPAVQCEGEVEICTHNFHLTRTNQNSQKHIDAVLAKRARIAADAKAERAHALEIELQEIADGAYGDNPRTRGLARDLLAERAAHADR